MIFTTNPNLKANKPSADLKRERQESLSKINSYLVAGKLAHQSKEVKVLDGDESSQPYCPFNKTCFNKKKPSLKDSHKYPVAISSSQKLCSSYRYKKRTLSSSKAPEGQFSVSKSSFLHVSRTRKEKMPKNYLAMESSIRGDLNNRSVYSAASRSSSVYL